MNKAQVFLPLKLCRMVHYINNLEHPCCGALSLPLNRSSCLHVDYSLPHVWELSFGIAVHYSEHLVGHLQIASCLVRQMWCYFTLQWVFYLYFLWFASRMIGAATSHFSEYSTCTSYTLHHWWCINGDATLHFNEYFICTSYSLNQGGCINVDATLTFS